MKTFVAGLVLCAASDTGIKGFLAYFSALPGGPQPIPETLNGLVAIQAEGDYVTLLWTARWRSIGIRR